LTWNDSGLVRAWQTSSSAREAAKKLNEPVISRVSSRVARLRKVGVPLKINKRQPDPIADIGALRELAKRYAGGVP
jgi:hypothetical protein